MQIIFKAINKKNGNMDNYVQSITPYGSLLYTDSPMEAMALSTDDPNFWIKLQFILQYKHEVFTHIAYELRVAIRYGNFYIKDIKCVNLNYDVTFTQDVNQAMSEENLKEAYLISERSVLMMLEEQGFDGIAPKQVIVPFDHHAWEVAHM